MYVCLTSTKYTLEDLTESLLCKVENLGINLILIELSVIKTNMANVTIFSN
jgi:hypothetical protein